MNVEVSGFKEFSRALRGVDSKYNNVARKVYRRAADLVAGRAAGAAGSLGSAIKPRSSNSSAFIETVPKPPRALPNLWGAKKRTGWYAASKYGASTGRQFPAWVGNQWDPGESGGMPYHIGPAINSSVDEVEQLIADGVLEAASEAFPD